MATENYQTIERGLKTRVPYPIHDMYKYADAREETVFLYPVARSEVNITHDQMDDILYGLGVDTYNRFGTLLEHYSRLNCEPVEKLSLLKGAWSSSDDVVSYGATLAHQIEVLSDFYGVHFSQVLDDDEKSWIAGLGNEVKLYRGCDESKIAGVSWTTNYNTAKSFAKGFRGVRHDNPVIVSAKCDIDDILLAIDEREEKEIIVKPEVLEDVLVTPFNKGLVD